VYAFEPEPFNFRLLLATVRDRKLENKVIPVHSAVGETDGEIELWINDHHHADHRIATDSMLAKGERKQDKFVRVPIVAVDRFVSESGRDRPIRLIKIDVQGYELAVCRGMAHTISRQPNALVAIEYMPEAMQDLGYEAHALLDWFQEREFKMYSLGRNGKLTLGLSDELTQKGYVDLIFSHDALI
jgi:FkbM family methyltransferase